MDLRYLSTIRKHLKRFSSILQQRRNKQKTSKVTLGLVAGVIQGIVLYLVMSPD
jgi:hypothetical protein